MNIGGIKDRDERRPWNVIETFLEIKSQRSLRNINQTHLWQQESLLTNFRFIEIYPVSLSENWKVKGKTKI